MFLTEGIANINKITFISTRRRVAVDDEASFLSKSDVSLSTRLLSVDRLRASRDRLRDRDLDERRLLLGDRDLKYLASTGSFPE